MKPFTGLVETGDGRIINLDNVNSISPHEHEGKLVSYRVKFDNNMHEEIDIQAFKDIKKYAINSEK